MEARTWRDEHATWHFDMFCMTAVMRASNGSILFQVPLTRDRIALNFSKPEGMILKKTRKVLRAAQPGTLVSDTNTVPLTSFDDTTVIANGRTKKLSGSAPGNKTPEKPRSNVRAFFIAILACKSLAAALGISERRVEIVKISAKASCRGDNVSVLPGHVFFAFP